MKRLTFSYTGGLMAAVLAGGSVVGNALKVSGDKTMTTAEPVSVYHSKRISDIAAVAEGDSAYLVIVEKSDQAVPSSLAPVSQKNTWRFWQSAQNGSSFREASQQTVVFPAAVSVVMALTKNRLIAFALVNEPKPGFLLSWDVGSPPRPAESSQSTVKVELDRAEAGMVHLNPRDDWNTRGLPSRNWLFHPSLQPLGSGSEVSLALNTADGHAVVWTSDGKQALPGPKVFVPDSLNPAFVSVAAKNYLLFRRMPEAWPMYYHDTRLSGTFGPVALPLMIAEQDAKGSLTQPRNVSNEASVGNVFDFVAGSTGDRLVIAAVTGTKQEPELRVYASEGSSLSLHLHNTTRLRQVPYRLTMAVAGKEALIGLASCQQDDCEVSGMVVEVR